MDNNQNPFQSDDLGEAIDQFKKWSSSRRSFLVKAGLVVLALVASSTAYFQVEPDEVGVVTRFGKFSRIAEPGPHLRLPLGIETVEKVPVQRQLKQEFGFRSETPGVRTSYRTGNRQTDSESVMLTGDLNVATVEWVIQYKIADPYKYLFKVRDVEETLRLMSEASMRQVVGDHSVTEVLTIGREKIASEAKQMLSELCKKYETGISVQKLVLQNVDPPKDVKPSFNEVNQAIQEREKSINAAWGEYNKEIPRAEGLAVQILEDAEGYAVDRVNRAYGDAERFWH